MMDVVLIRLQINKTSLNIQVRKKIRDLYRKYFDMQSKLIHRDNLSQQCDLPWHN